MDASRFSLEDRYNVIINKYKGVSTSVAFEMFAESLLRCEIDPDMLSNSDYVQGWRHGVDTIAHAMLTLANDMKK